MKDRIFFDTSALVEFFDATAKGKEVSKFINADYDLFTSSLVLAELTSKLKRRKFDPEGFMKALESSMQIMPLTSEIAKRGGYLHSQLKPKVPNISLADCLIMTHADDEDALVITCDRHFEHYKKARIL